MIRSSLLLFAAGAVLLALPASAAAASAPPPGALVAQDAAGSSVAVWTAADGTLQTARQVVGQPWSRTVTLYTPSRLCKYQGKQCTADRVSPHGLVVSAGGQGFFAVVQTITNPTGHCDRIVAGRVSTHRTGGQLGAISVSYGECGRAQRNQGSVDDVQTAVAADGTAALGYHHVTPRFPENDEAILNVFARGAVTAGGQAVQPMSRIDSPELQVGIDDLGRATMVWRATEAPAVLYSVDIIDGASTVEVVSPRSGVADPALMVNPDGTQTVTYQGAALVGQAWVRGTVSQTRPAAGQPWSAPVPQGT